MSVSLCVYGCVRVSGNVSVCRRYSVSVCVVSVCVSVCACVYVYICMFACITDVTTPNSLRLLKLPLHSIHLFAASRSSLSVLCEMCALRVLSSSYPIPPPILSCQTLSLTLSTVTLPHTVYCDPPSPCPLRPFLTLSTVTLPHPVHCDPSSPCPL